MKNKDYNTLNNTAKVLREETEARFATARQIVKNLYFKHFQNFMSYSEYQKAFPWMHGFQITARGVEALDGSRIPQVFLSNDVRRIASNARRLAYQHALKLATQELERATYAEKDARRLLENEERRMQRATANREQAAKQVVRMRKVR